LTLVAVDLRNCETVPENISYFTEVLASQFLDTKLVGGIIGTANVKDFGNILYNATDALSLFTVGNFSGAGAEVGNIIRYMEVKVQDVENNLSKLDKIFLFTSGLIHTTFEKQVPAFDSCTSDISSFKSEIATVKADFKGFKLIQGVKDAIALVKSVPHTLKDCLTLPKELIVEVFHVVKGLFNIKLDIVTIVDIFEHHVADLQNGMADIQMDIKRNDFYEMGVDAGKLFNLLKLA
jgi:hypothetical protein